MTLALQVIYGEIVISLKAAVNYILVCHLHLVNTSRCQFTGTFPYFFIRLWMWM